MMKENPSEETSVTYPLSVSAMIVGVCGIVHKTNGDDGWEEPFAPPHFFLLFISPQVTGNHTLTMPTNPILGLFTYALTWLYDANMLL